MFKSAKEKDSGGNSKHYWDKKKRKDATVKPTEHYEELDNLQYGYNFTWLKYPIDPYEEVFQKFRARHDDLLPLPLEFVTVNDKNIKCKHGNLFNGDQIDLYNEVTVVEEHRERVLPITVSGLGTDGACKVSQSVRS